MKTSTLLFITTALAAPIQVKREADAFGTYTSSVGLAEKLNAGQGEEKRDAFLPAMAGGGGLNFRFPEGGRFGYKEKRDASAYQRVYPGFVYGYNNGEEKRDAEAAAYQRNYPSFAYGYNKRDAAAKYYPQFAYFPEDGPVHMKREADAYFYNDKEKRFMPFMGSSPPPGMGSKKNNMMGMNMGMNTHGMKREAQPFMPGTNIGNMRYSFPQMHGIGRRDAEPFNMHPANSMRPGWEMIPKRSASADPSILGDAIDKVGDIGDSIGSIFSSLGDKLANVSDEIASAIRAKVKDTSANVTATINGQQVPIENIPVARDILKSLPVVGRLFQRSADPDAYMVPFGQKSSINSGVSGGCTNPLFCAALKFKRSADPEPQPFEVPWGTTSSSTSGVSGGCTDPRYCAALKWKA